MRIFHSRIQHGVGQGSFHFASVEVASEGGARQRFDYVYDCGAPKGSTDLKNCIERAVSELEPDSSGQRAIDALVISHYDQDHLNGVDQLVKACPVKRIFLPYLSPPELMLLVARTPDISLDYLRLLQGLALGAERLYDVPITMVMTGEDPPLDLEGTGEQTESGRLSPLQGGLDKMPRVRPGSELSLGLSNGPAVWRLKFWNMGTTPDVLADVFEALVAIEFPILALQDPSATEEASEWLAKPENCQAAKMAYRSALSRSLEAEYSGELSSKRLPNAISLCLYSGPAKMKTPLVAWHHSCHESEECHCCDWPYCARRWSYPSSVGWLGTGEASLGESAVWADFIRHYGSELRDCVTVQVPHHGAAPLQGAKTFNPALFPHAHMNAVISFGFGNTYGHPAATVLKEIVDAQAHLRLVSDGTYGSYLERVVIDVLPA